jgi:hypothetical protein
MIIAVIGDSSCSPEEAKLAETVGELLAQRGVTIVCGANHIRSDSHSGRNFCYKKNGMEISTRWLNSRPFQYSVPYCASLASASSVVVTHKRSSRRPYHSWQKSV